ncbi:hypothetical protein K144316041_p20230 (plasmid) [Clostridium tetani]|uniref:phage morphogenesis protein n=1 Tax=Clostridium tetani TaxID=1513 RepID=UPI002953B783|nr:phage morphogenesis protein [Clostridium tetani]BDR74184.1 hypothetical protein K144316041_p20230 [Clostridium tetani]
MATEFLKSYRRKYNHEVGNLCSWKIRVLPYGALVVDKPIDNFTLVELGFDENGERICKQLSDVKRKGYLIASPERRYLESESMTSFFNDVEERVRIVFLDEGIRFDTSAFELNEGVKELKNGLVAHFDPTKKKFIISNGTSAHADYTTARDKFWVVSDEDNMEYLCGKETVRLEVMA